ncbi:HlyD family efflux transporter periplasmic adaptor subunit [Subdoligranulum sp. DSM 109015]|uniref:HlyD family efflux transporter periplasmic adaptor subunit n=1 Tax=Gemmiger gallinarum TaxID=2779354 RepID=A0ABR9R2R0_9FIRM|nr:HlyD family efflux transporter periplasmic adaptor subunit [Gemmiger gallinarum]MBE5037430.1 HlyD family efflux transporter periplasmic adaptor subunit [Gemmiger gallinarum]
MEDNEFGTVPQPVGEELPEQDWDAEYAEDTQPGEEASAPQPFKRKNWFARHKKLTVALAVVILAAAAILIRLLTRAVPASGTTYQYVRTTTLTRTSLEDSVTVTGTVASGSEASVTVADNAKTYKVATVEVEVGDTVQAGDVICTLDTSDLEKQIDSAELSYSDTLQSAQTTYDRALESYEVAVVKHDNSLIDLQENIDKADENLTKAQENLDSAKSARDSAQSTVNSCQSTVDSLQSAYNAAQGIASYVSSYDMAADALNSAAAALDSAYQSYTTAYMNYAGAADQEAAKAALQQAVSALQNAFDTYGSGTVDTTANASVSAANQRTVTGTIAPDVASINSQLSGIDVTLLVAPASTTLIDTFNAAAQALVNQESAAASGTGMTYQQVVDTYTQAQSQLSAAKTALTQAETAVTTAETQVESAETQVESAHDAYDNEKNSTTLTTAWQQVEDAETRLEQAKRTPDTLQTLRDTLEDCTLTATMSGTITELNATVGSACTGTVATIQNTDGLTVEVTISADDVADVKTGMECNITSDSTGDSVIKGTLSQIDPVANEQGTFGAKVTVDTADSGLLIGIQAQAEILKSVTDNVFVVPIDAVGTAEDGSSFVYRKTGGEGVDMTFEQVTVTTGDANDYYVEISGDDLAEGDVIRATADLTEGIETGTVDADSQIMVALSGMDGGPAGQAPGGDMPSGEMPSGGDRGGAAAGGQGGPGGGM